MLFFGKSETSRSAELSSALRSGADEATVAAADLAVAAKRIAIAAAQLAATNAVSSGVGRAIAGYAQQLPQAASQAAQTLPSMIGQAAAPILAASAFRLARSGKGIVVLGIMAAGLYAASRYLNAPRTVAVASPPRRRRVATARPAQAKRTRQPKRSGTA